MELWVVIALWVVSLSVASILWWRFLHNIIKYSYVGNTFIYIAVPYLVCLAFAITANIVTAPSNPLTSIAVSFFDALKMMAIAFDRDVVIGYFAEFWSVDFWFGVGYVASSVAALSLASTSVIYYTVKTIFAKIRCFFKARNKKTDLCYIFSDPQAKSTATMLAEELRKDKIVVMYLHKSLIKTQEGAEYRDFLQSKGFDVRTETFSAGICKKLFGKFGNSQNVYVYGIFSNDTSSVVLCDQFMDAILSSKSFIALKQAADNGKTLTEAQFDMLNKFRVFVTYQKSDIDLNNNFSKKTLGIINTISHHDIISTEFIIDNPLCNLINLNEVDDNQNSHCMNVTFLGFGKVNRPIFEKMTIAYQLWGDNINKVSYHILDKDAARLCANCQNEYTDPKSKTTPKNGKLSSPFLYNVDYDCDGLDLTEFRIIDDHVRKIAGRADRFAQKGFNMFIVSVSDTNKDIEIATWLRKCLLKHVPADKLKNTLVYVRIGNPEIARNFIENNGGSFIIEQSAFTKEYMLSSTRPLVPIIIFGDNTVMSNYIDKHYKVINRLGVASQLAYQGGDMPKAKMSWITSDKKGVLNNITTTYSLKTKLAIFGLALDENYRILDSTTSKALEKDEYERLLAKYFDDAHYPEDFSLEKPIYKLAELEHNRWVAAAYLIHRYSPWNIEEYLAANQATSPGSDLVTKYQQSRHICMLTNESLKQLRDITVQTYNALEGSADKLTFSNDILNLKNIYYALYDCVPPKQEKTIKVGRKQKA